MASLRGRVRLGGTRWRRGSGVKKRHQSQTLPLLPWPGAGSGSLHRGPHRVDCCGLRRAASHIINALVGADCHTLVISGTRRTKRYSIKCQFFQYFAYMENKEVVFNYSSVFVILSLISIINVQNCSLQGERRCGVCQMLNKWFLYILALQDITVTRLEAPGQQTPGQRCGRELPGTPCIPRVGVRLVLQQAVGHCHTSCVCAPPPSLTCTRRTVTAPRPQQGVWVDTLCRSRVGGIPGLPWARILPSPNTSLLLRIHNIIQIRTFGEKLPGHIHFCCFIKHYGPCRGRGVSDKVPISSN